ncbi:MAG: hypothetical protein CSYNP_03193 [Syntrophus sp. SKADARSKE-3]|nr:hypothetical protein [Syntrophus sp. SKADARSKE-3]
MGASPSFIPNEMMLEEIKNLALVINPARLTAFYGLLQKGVMVRANVGQSIGAILCQDFGLKSSYIQERISTIFLNGKPVDDIESAVLKGGDVLALSGAMPGLVGATLRCGGAYRSMRAAITYREEGMPCGCEPGFFRLKLFNILIQEFGPPLLERGIVINADELADFFARQPDVFWRDCQSMVLNGAPLDPVSVCTYGLPDRDGHFLLTVTAAGGTAHPASGDTEGYS